MTDLPEQFTGYRLRDYDDLIARLRASWLTRGITADDVAHRIAYGDPAVVPRILAGRQGTRAARLFALADALGYDLALIPREEQP